MIKNVICKQDFVLFIKIKKQINKRYFNYVTVIGNALYNVYYVM